MTTVIKTLFALFFSFVLVFGIPTQTYAQGTQAWRGVCTDTGDATGVATIQGFQCLIANVLRIAVTGIGLAGFVMLIVGSFRYLLSGGNPKGIDEGKKTMTYAVLGLVMALSAYFILRIIADFTGVDDILNFTIPAPSGQPAP